MMSRRSTPSSKVRIYLLIVLRTFMLTSNCLTVAVGAFRVAVELDLKRRDNDKKISLMFVEMRDMMAVLVQYVRTARYSVSFLKISRYSPRLKDVNKDKRAGDDNTTISGRMQHLVDKTEQDIRKCANSCNTYAKKKLLSKVVHSSSWSDEFKGYIQAFTDRRREFELALSIYIGHAVNTANDKLVTIEEKCISCLLSGGNSGLTVTVSRLEWTASSVISMLACPLRSVISRSSSTTTADPT